MAARKSSKQNILTMSAKDFVASQKAEGKFCVNATMTDEHILDETYELAPSAAGEIDPTQHTIVMIGIEPSAHCGQSSHPSEKFSVFETNYIANETFGPLRSRIENALTPKAEANDGRTIYLVIPNDQIHRLGIVGKVRTYKTIEKMRTAFKCFYGPKPERPHTPKADASASDQHPMRTTPSLHSRTSELSI